MATKGLKMKKALVVGQAAPGVPLWRCDERAAKWPGLPYVVFPGDVGSESTLLEIVERWRVGACNGLLHSTAGEETHSEYH